MSKKVNKFENVKKTLFKILHIVCYILSALFIIIAVVAGVQSCNKKSTRLNADNDYSLKLTKSNVKTFGGVDYFVYRFKYGVNESFLIPRSEQATIFPSYLGDFEESYDSLIVPGYQYYGNFINNAYCLSNDNRLINILSLSSRWVMLSDGGPVYMWVLSGLYYAFEPQADDNLDYYFFAVREDETYYDDADTYRTSARIPYLYLTEQIYDNAYLNLLFEPVYETTSFIFNKQFNYNALLGGNIGSYYGYPSINGFTGFDYSLPVYEFTPGYFVSNEEIFNKIRYVTESTNGYFYWDNQQNKIVQASNTSQYFYKYIEYVNTTTGLVRRVNTHDRVFATADNIAGSQNYYYYLTSSTWLNDAYRYITFLEPLTDDYRVNLQSFNNNNQSYFNGGVISGNNAGDNVFDLLSYAFLSIQPLFSIMILPSITIGTLIFLPLVVTIIFVIIKLIKK